MRFKMVDFILMLISYQQQKHPPFFTGSDVQPSIKGRRLYIPLEAWFTYGGAKTASAFGSLTVSRDKYSN